MPRREAGISLAQMRDHAKEALLLVRGATRADLDADRKLNLALVRLLEIIGEAATRVPPEARAQYPQIPGRNSSRSAIASFMATIKSISTFSGKSSPTICPRS